MHANPTDSMDETPVVGGSPRGEETTRRILNLLFSLNVAAEPLTTTQIINDPEIGYRGDNRASREKAFQRDRKTLLDLGVHVHEVDTPGRAMNEQRGWEIDRAHTHAAIDALAPYDAEEAVAAIDQIFVLNAEDPARWPLQTARAKLCAAAGIPSSPDSAATSHEPAHLEHIWSAFERRRPVAFTYRNARGEQRERMVSIYGIFEQGTFVYLVGLDEGSGSLRTFRTDRISKVKPAPNSRKPYVIPAEFDVSGHQFLPFDFDETEAVPARFSFPKGVDRNEISLITKGRGQLTQTESEAWTWDVGVRNIDAAARFALEHASCGMTVEEPAELRQHLLNLIEKAVQAHVG